MRGIGFIGGEGPSPETARRLAGGAGLIAAADSGLMAAEAAGLRPHWIVGDMDSLDDRGRLKKYPPDRVRIYDRAKDDTDTELALSLLWKEGCNEVWLLGGGGGRLDHILALRALFERPRPPNRWITAGEDVRCLEGGEILELEAASIPAPVSGPAGASANGPAGGGPFLVSVFPLGEGPWEAESRGLRWPLGGLEWNRGSFGVSNEAPAGACSLRSLRGRFMVVIQYGHLF
ncbi:MAG: thiamine diphosphokinase [Treponema sp.]|nr:thiamine diphosphokinase [Treponema sp.]